MKRPAQSRMERKSRATRLWIGIFALWLLLLSGVTAPFLGSPGVIQAARLVQHLEAKKLQITQMESEVAGIEAESVRLEKSRLAQEREIRGVLGYAASDELIFDFAAAERAQETPPR